MTVELRPLASRGGFDQTIPRGDAVALARALVQADSRNPSLVPNAPGERDVAHVLRDVLTAWGLEVELQDVKDGRPNVVSRIGANHELDARRSLMLNGHLDTVGIEGMTHSPFGADERDGRMYGRGATDMKSGVAPMCAAAGRAADQGATGEIVIAGVIDEEFASAGTRALIERGVRADAAIVTEPTALAIMPAHRG